MWATSAIGIRAIWAPSKAQPPAVAPGFGLAQPDFDFLLCSQAGSLSNSAMSLGFISGFLGISGWPLSVCKCSGRPPDIQGLSQMPVSVGPLQVRWSHLGLRELETNAVLDGNVHRLGEPRRRQGGHPCRRVSRCTRAGPPPELQRIDPPVDNLGRGRSADRLHEQVAVVDQPCGRRNCPRPRPAVGAAHVDEPALVRAS